MSEANARIRRFMREASGIAFEDEKSYFIEDRLAPLMEAAHLSSLDDLALRLEADRHSEFARTVVDTLTINETSFFRDRALFAALREQVLPHLIAAKASTQRLRIWCAGCSTGQEPYSVAMLLEDVMRHHGGWSVEVLATDVSGAAVDRARSGIYSQFEVQRGLPIALLLRHFGKLGSAWQIGAALRAKVQFETRNLLEPVPGRDPFDLIFCRNVLLYFDAATRSRVLRRLQHALAPSGLLALGAAERVGAACPALVPGFAPFIFSNDPDAGVAGCTATRHGASTH